MVAIISEYSRRPLRALVADGLNDILMGLMYLGVALLAYIGILEAATIQPLIRQGSSISETLSQRDALTHELIAISYHFVNVRQAIIYVMGGVAIVGGLAIEPLRRRFVYPRTGYVAQRGQKNHPILQWIGAILIFIPATILFSSLFAWVEHNTHSWSMAQISSTGVMIGGAIPAIVFGGLFLRFGFVRHLIIAGISITTAVLLVSTPIPFQYYSLIFELVLGGSLVILGADAFMKILRIPVATEHDVE